MGPSGSPPGSRRGATSCASTTRGCPITRAALSTAGRPTGRARCSRSKLASENLTRRLLEGIELAAFAVSLGGVESILSWPARMSHAAMPAPERAARGISDNLVRLSVGLEDPDDLIADLDRLIGDSL